MLENQPCKSVSWQGSFFESVGITIKVLEGDLSVLVGKDISLRDHAPVQITGQILQSRISLSRKAAINDPILGVNRSVKTQSQLFQTGQELSPEQAVQYPLGDQEAVSGMDTQSFIRLEGNTGNNKVDMRMEIQPSAMGVQDTGEADKAAKKSRVQGCLPERLGSGME